MSIPDTLGAQPAAGAAADPGREPGLWTWAACAVALLTLAGSLYLSLGLKLKACPLCFYQRTFVMGALGVLLVGLLAGRRGGSLSLLALPAAVGGCAVGVFHVSRELIGVMECPAGLSGVLSAPQEALIAQTLLVVLLVADVLRGPQSFGARLAGALGTLLLGTAFAAAAIVSVPPPPSPPRTAPYDPVREPLDICRPPVRAAQGP
jgi:disulfide bond formation protein DsbB